MPSATLKTVPTAELEADRDFYAKLVSGQAQRPANVFELNDRKILALIDYELSARDAQEDRHGNASQGEL